MGQMAGNMMNPNVANPQQAQWGDLDPSEKGARVLAGGIKGVGPALQNYFQQKTQMANSGGGPMIQPQQSQMVSPDFFQPQRRGANNLSFYGDSNG